MAWQRRRIERTRRGDFRLRLTRSERDVLRSLPEQLRELIAADDASVRRLFPPAYGEDEAKNAEYARLTREDLVARRLDALRVMEETVEADRLDEEQLTAWLGALNDLRLTLGTRLDVTEETYATAIDPRDPHARELALFAYLTWLEEQVVAELAAGLDTRPGLRGER